MSQFKRTWINDIAYALAYEAGILSYYYTIVFKYGNWIDGKGRYVYETGLQQWIFM